MAKRSRQVSDDSSDDEAPEAVSFGTSKKVAKGEQDALQQHHAAQKQKRKEKNRALDQALKDRSANTKGTGKNGVVSSGKPSKKAQAARSEDEGSDGDEVEESTKGGQSREELEERMARAMMEAEDESGSEEGHEGFAGFGDSVEMEVEGEEEEMSDERERSGSEDEDEDEDLLAEEGSGGSEDEDEDEEMGSEDEDEDEDEGVSSTKPSSSPQKDDYLPDHLFKTAFSRTGKKIVFDDDDPLPVPEASPPRKRRRTKRTSKDILLGCAYTRSSILPAH
uniref:MARTX n=1 Tax=Ganoderma boninense TaxID=34458 RepID=A0A5K1K271_9APHY|nr:MARTX [Ganoderma boninense]